ncbi:MAG: DUF2004 domain-containing protein [Planctomycetaceae bacterium]|nr:DUF2004 domain-containing protein [Planctomycetaceae bacterium]MCB9951515.1 DUF2004 domain-containing protein [Planctomycetaceae bacterium]
MATDKNEIERRRITALAAIKQAFGTAADKFGGTLFVSHHLEELDADYWQKLCGTAQPKPEQVLDILTLRSHWGEDDEDGIDTFDFSLPDDATNYVVSVSFDENGDVVGITMES